MRFAAFMLASLALTLLPGHAAAGPAEEIDSLSRFITQMELCPGGDCGATIRQKVKELISDPPIGCIPQLGFTCH